jgi:N4-gp56 family major capsid protein
MAAQLGTSPLYAGDVQRFLDKEVLPVAQRHLVVRQFASKIRIPEHMGMTYTATRYNRFTLPAGPIAEGVPPLGQSPTISQITGVVMQWGDRANITDIAEITPLHDVLTQASRMLQLQLPETLERNMFGQLNAAVQVNFVNQKGSRAALAAGDLLDPVTVNRTVANLTTLGAFLFNGATGAHDNKSIEEGPRKARGKPESHEHFVAVAHPIALNDFANNSTVQLAWSYSDIGKLYINEVGQWRGMHFVESNMVPYWVGLANNDSGLTYTPAITGGALATGNYVIQVTGSDPQNQYEQRIYQVSGTQNIASGAAGSIAVLLPSAPSNYNYAVYISSGVGTQPNYLATGTGTGVPAAGPFSGQLTGLPAGATVIVTGLGIPQVPPAAPATGVNVFPTYVFGEHFFAALELDNVTWHRLSNADKSDPLNQLRIIGWKTFDGAVILNQLFGARIESSASSTGAFG